MRPKYTTQPVAVKSTRLVEHAMEQWHFLFFAKTANVEHAHPFVLTYQASDRRIDVTDSDTKVMFVSLYVTRILPRSAIPAWDLRPTPGTGAPFRSSFSASNQLPSNTADHGGRARLQADRV